MLHLDIHHTPNLLRNLAYLSEVDLKQQYEGLTKTMTDFNTDETRLEADVAAEGADIAQVQAATQSNADALAAANTEIAALKAQGVDTTKMEAALSTMEANNATLAGIGQPAAPPTTADNAPPTDPTVPANAPPATTPTGGDPAATPGT